MAKKKTVKSGADTSLANPQNRTEEFLAKIAGLVDSTPSGEFSRLERYLKAIIDKEGAEFSPTDTQLAAINSGATAELIGLVSAANAAANNNGLQGNMGFVEDTIYAGCFYRNVTVNNQTVREWLNPPLEYGEVYRTTERFRGKAVYAKNIDMGFLTSDGTADGTAVNQRYVLHNIDDIDKLVRCEGHTNSWSVPTTMLPGANNIIIIYADIGGVYACWYTADGTGTFPTWVKGSAVLYYTLST